MPDVHDRASLAETLTRFGISFLTEATSPAVMALFRLAVAEAERAPSLAQRLNERGRAPTFAALVDFFTRAATSGLPAATASIQ